MNKPTLRTILAGLFVLVAVAIIIALISIYFRLPSWTAAVGGAAVGALLGALTALRSGPQPQGDKNNGEDVPAEEDSEDVEQVR